MHIRNNLAAYNAHRIFSVNGQKRSKNIEKLSSGLKINRAADDAAGLAISEKMRAQIRGLSMAQKNVQDGISLIQTAEGALESIHDVLHRMNELAVQAANDINQDADREALNYEYRELINEIDSIAANTDFNGRPLLDGSAAGSFSMVSNLVSYDVKIDATPYTFPTDSINFSTDFGGAYSALADEIANNIVPQIVNQMKNILPSLASFFESDIEIGLDFVSNHPAYAFVSIGSGSNNISLNLTVDLDEINGIWSGSDFMNEAGRNELEAVLTHEMTHALMGVITSVGMVSSDSYPLWFIEGMAQTMSGHMGWVSSLSGSSSDATIKAYLNESALKDNSNAYSSGYLATMYLAWSASGKGTVNGADLADGVDLILSELASGKSLDRVIQENTSYKGLDDFVKNMGNNKETYDFVRALRSATGSGLGGVLNKNLTNTNPVPDGSSSSTFLKVNLDYTRVYNIYPSGLSPNIGAGAYNDGKSIDGIAPPASSGGGGSSSGGLIIQSGANKGDELIIIIAKMDSHSIGSTNASGKLSKSTYSTDLKSHANASEAITVVNGAINMVSSQRADLGAIQNRMEHKLNSLGVLEENLISAESRIRDVDMAKEMTGFTKNNILSNAAQAMLAQANSLPQAVLSLFS